MNNPRRKRIAAIQGKLSELMEELNAILEEEQEAFDNFPETLQESERGQVMQEAIDNLEYAVGCFEEIDGYLEEAQN